MRQQKRLGFSGAFPLRLQPTLAWLVKLSRRPHASTVHTSAAAAATGTMLQRATCAQAMAHEQQLMVHDGL